MYTERLIKRSTLEMAFTPGRTNDGKEIVARQVYSCEFGWLIGSLDVLRVIQIEQDLESLCLL